MDQIHKFPHTKESRHGKFQGNIMIVNDPTDILYVGALCTAENLGIGHYLITQNVAPRQLTPRDVLGWHGFDWDFQNLQVCLIFRS
jgi:hypothetical protein